MKDIPKCQENQKGESGINTMSYSGEQAPPDEGIDYKVQNGEHIRIRKEV